jgi:hypothetical protein
MIDVQIIHGVPVVVSPLVPRGEMVIANLRALANMEILIKDLRAQGAKVDAAVYVESDQARDLVRCNITTIRGRIEELLS